MKNYHEKYYISVGDQILTPEGFIEINNYNGHCLACSEYEVTSDGVFYCGDMYLTLKEVEKIFHSVNGYFYHVIFE